MADEVYEFLRAGDSRVELVREAALLAPMRWPADFDGDPAFQRDRSAQQEFQSLVDSADVLYGIPDSAPAALRRAVRANPGLRWVQTMAAGGGAQVKAAGLTADELARVVFTTSAGVHAGPLAEFALFGLLAGAKHLPRLLTQQTQREWSGRWPMAQLRDQTVVVVGLGAIGREVARVTSSLGARVIGVKRGTDRVDGVDTLASPAELAAVAAKADALVITLPGTAATEGMVSADVLTRLRPGATVVSVGRGTVLDEPALVDGLRTGHIGFAALDVFAVEPLPTDSLLWSLPNVVISPHTAANSASEERLIAELFLHNLDAHLAGRRMRNIVDVVEFY
ncbi:MULTISPECIES: D-2-hydroxyacid dehydrogenase [unclassified Modestobacter]